MQCAGFLGELWGWQYGWQYSCGHSSCCRPQHHGTSSRQHPCSYQRTSGSGKDTGSRAHTNVAGKHTRRSRPAVHGGVSYGFLGG